jgi:hypothetical protein
MHQQIFKQLSAKNLKVAGRQRASSESMMLPARNQFSAGRFANPRNANSFRAGEQHLWRDNAFLIAQSAGLGLVLSGVIARNSNKNDKCALI